MAVEDFLPKMYTAFVVAKRSAGGAMYAMTRFFLADPRRSPTRMGSRLGIHVAFAHNHLRRKERRRCGGAPGTRGAISIV
jgi:hypothetical protein